MLHTHYVRVWNTQFLHFDKMDMTGASELQEVMPTVSCRRHWQAEFLFSKLSESIPSCPPPVLWTRPVLVLIILPPKRNPATDSGRFTLMFQTLKVSIDSLCSLASREFSWSKGLKQKSPSIAYLEGLRNNCTLFSWVLIPSLCLLLAFVYVVLTGALKWKCQVLTNGLALDHR